MEKEKLIAQDIAQLQEAGFPLKGETPPTLSEILDQCGDEFESLVRVRKDGIQTWGIIRANQKEGKAMTFILGDTPEQAAKNLYCETKGIFHG